MKKRWSIIILIVSTIIITVTIGAIITKDYKKAEKHLLYSDEIKNYSIDFIAIHDEDYQPIVTIRDEDEIKEFVDSLLRTKISVDNSLKTEIDTMYNISIYPVREKKGIFYGNSYLISVTKERIYFNNPYGYSIVYLENHLFNHIENIINKKQI